MNVTDDIKLQSLLEHYKDTFKYIREYLKSRERLFILALLIVLLMSFDLSTSLDHSKIVSTLIEKKIGLKLIISPLFIGSLIWFTLLSIIVRYCQVTILIERQYKYIHNLEDELCNFGGDYYHREGKAYKKDYPLYLRWTRLLYTIIFPIFLLITISAKMWKEMTVINKLMFYFYIDLLIYIMLLITIILYILQIRFHK